MSVEESVVESLANQGCSCRTQDTFYRVARFVGGYNKGRSKTRLLLAGVSYSRDTQPLIWEVIRIQLYCTCIIGVSHWSNEAMDWIFRPSYIFIRCKNKRVTLVSLSIIAKPSPMFQIRWPLLHFPTHLCLSMPPWLCSGQPGAQGLLLVNIPSLLSLKLLWDNRRWDQRRSFRHMTHFGAIRMN